MPIKFQNIVNNIIALRLTLTFEDFKLQLLHFLWTNKVSQLKMQLSRLSRIEACKHRKQKDYVVSLLNLEIDVEALKFQVNNEVQYKCSWWACSIFWKLKKMIKG